MLKKILIALTLSLLVLLGTYAATSTKATAAKVQLKQNTPESRPARSSLDEGGTGTLQKMIVESGSVTMDLDLNGLNGSGSLVARPVTLHFAAAANSFLPILFFNNLLPAPEACSSTLIPQ